MSKQFVAKYVCESAETDLAVTRFFTDRLDFAKQFLVGQQTVFPMLLAQGWKFLQASIRDRETGNQTMYEQDEILSL